MLLSRTAEAMYWFGRYLERAHALSLALKAYEELMLDMPGSPAVRHGWAPLAELAGFRAQAEGEPLDLADFLLDQSNASSVLGALHQARENLRQSRPSVPMDVWETLNALYLRLRGLTDREQVTLSRALADAVAASRQLQGEISVEMLRDSTLGFLSIGIHLERADMVLRTLLVLSKALGFGAASQAFDDVRLSGVLRAVAAHAMYRRRHRLHTTLESVLDFVLLDSEFPRSVAYCLARIEARLERLPEPGRALSVILRARPDPAAVHAAALGSGVVAHCERLLERIARIDGALAERYFSGAAA